MLELRLSRVNAVFVLLLICPLGAMAADNGLDDISIQVIGLDEVPEEALERIPLPAPDFGGLTDIGEGIILNRPGPGGGPDGSLVGSPSPDEITSGDNLSPPPTADSGNPPETAAGGSGPPP